VTAFGLGSSLYQPGFGVAEIRRRADAAVAAYDAVFG
jgi:2-dehydro-3-deoxyphosphogalactonate aldolase